MIVFENGIDIRCREATKPQVAKLRVDNPNCAFRQIELSNGAEPVYKFIVIGTQYGHIHTSGGDVRMWGSYSGAYKFLKQYQPL